MEDFDKIFSLEFFRRAPRQKKGLGIARNDEAAADDKNRFIAVRENHSVGQVASCAFDCSGFSVLILHELFLSAARFLSG
jgi:hypothetical protein